MVNLTTPRRTVESDAIGPGLRFWRLAFSIVLGVSSAVFVLAMFARTAQAVPNLLYVAPGAACNGPTPCYDNLQAAVDAASPGDEILVAAGVYTAVFGRPRQDFTTTGTITQAVYISKTLTLHGGYSTSDWTTANPFANPTIVDAQNQGRVLYITGDISPTILGLRLMRGNATGLEGYEYPGYDVGGNVYIITATATLSANLIVDSSPAFSGGGLYARSSALNLDSNTILANQGGGLYLEYSTGALTQNVISGNIATGGYGGGIYIAYTNLTLEANRIMSNTAYQGGGVYLLLNDSVFNSNLIISNSAPSGQGGGVYMQSSSPSFENNVIADNTTTGTGSGVYVMTSHPSFTHTTFARNTGGDGSAVYLTDWVGSASSLVMTNTVLVSHTVGLTATTGPTNTASLNGVLWFGNGADTGGLGLMTVTNAITGDPLFAPDGYHLLGGSAAINAAVDAGAASDIDGDLRPILGLPDLGADEFADILQLFLPNISR